MVSYGAARNGRAEGNAEPVGRILGAQLNDNQFLVAGFHTRVDFSPADAGKYRQFLRVEEQVSIRFDGVYRNSSVWINGVPLGSRPYGSTTFEYDLTPHLRLGASANVLAERVDHSVVADSRWYPSHLMLLQSAWILSWHHA